MYIGGYTNAEAPSTVYLRSAGSLTISGTDVYINGGLTAGGASFSGISVGSINCVGKIKTYELETQGAKKRIVNTKDYGVRSLYCYEMPYPMFGDTGEGITDENGECYIYLDDVFSETVSAQIEYQVFLQKEGPGDIWIAKKTPQYFVVQGTENLKFAWEIKAKQRDYEFEHIEEVVEETEEKEFDYEQFYIDEYNNLIKKQEEDLYETA